MTKLDTLIEASAKATAASEKAFKAEQAARAEYEAIFRIACDARNSLLNHLNDMVAEKAEQIK